MIYYVPLCNKHCNGTFEICLLMCVTVSGGTYESFKHPILFLKYGCDIRQDSNVVQGLALGEMENASCRLRPALG